MRPGPARLAVTLGVVAVLLTPAVVAAASTGARAPGVPRAPAPTYRLPLDPSADVARGFERPPEPWAAGHRGVDLRSFPGADVLSPTAGIVTYAGTVGGRPVVTVTDTAGRRSSMEPLLPVVAVGDLVTSGARLGTVTTVGSHCAPATCLHWGVRVGSEYVDPLALLPGAGPVVLLPLG